MTGEYIMNIFILDHNPKIAAQSQCDNARCQNDCRICTDVVYCTSYARWCRD